MGRGKAQHNVELIEAAAAILAEIQPASVRAVCYQLFTRQVITSMAKNETNRVSEQLREARERELIPWDWIVDETREPETITAWDDPVAYFETVKRAYRKNRWADQVLHAEIWSEKGTVRGTLAPVLTEYGVTFRVMHGYGSTTVLHDIAEASARSRTPWVALYVGDWDPSGLHMSEVDLPGRLRRYGGEVAIERVALQQNHLLVDPSLPSFPAKEKKSDARYRWFQTWSREVHAATGDPRLNGNRCWELDALNPKVLRRDVEKAILQRLDVAAWKAAAITEEAERDSIVSILATWPGISGQARE